MADYTTLPEVNALLKRLAGLVISTTTEPTTAQVNDWITDESAVIDAKLTMRYVVPVTAATSLKILNDIATVIVVWRTFPVAFPAAETNPFDALYKAKVAILAEIQKGTMQLSDAAESGDSGDIGVQHNLLDDSFDPATDYEFKVGRTL